jgi:hypothetical protein
METRSFISSWQHSYCKQKYYPIKYLLYLLRSNKCGSLSVVRLYIFQKFLDFWFKVPNQMPSLSTVIFVYIKNAINRIASESLILLGRISKQESNTTKDIVCWLCIIMLYYWTILDSVIIYIASILIYFISLDVTVHIWAGTAYPSRAPKFTPGFYIILFYILIRIK